MCFRVASGLAWASTGHGTGSWAPHRRDWQIGGAHLVGSVAFAASAVASYVPDTDQVRNATLMTSARSWERSRCWSAGCSCCRLAGGERASSPS